MCRARLDAASLLASLALAACGAGERRADAGSKSTPAGPPTFAAAVAPLIHAKCSPCHHEGGPGPFALVTHGEVRDHAAQIVEVTASGYMPPWLPEVGAGEARFALEQQRHLSAGERALLAAWVEAGAPLGEPSELPPPPQFPSGWQLGEPDLKLEAAAAFALPADGVDVYRNFVIPVPDGPPRFVAAVELLPGPAQVVHHAVMRVDHSGEARRLDAEDETPGFDGMVFGGARMPGGRFIGWTPGKSPDPGSDARSWLLSSGADLVVQVHLRPTGKPESIRPVVGLHFASQPPSERGLAMVLSSTAIDIAPGEAEFRVRDSMQLPAAVEILSIYPHAHYVGKQLRGYATLPDGRLEELIEIRDWDFNWQDQYRYLEPVVLPAGTTITMDYRYDNSADNPRNPASPPRRVVYGPASTDEMAELIVEIEPVDPAALPVLDQAFMAKWLSGQIETVERTLAQQGQDPEQLANLAALLARAGRVAEARASFESALSLRDDPDTRVELAILLDGSGDPAAAAEQLDAALALDPSHARAWLVRGDIARVASRYDQARGAYEQAIAADATLVEAHNNLGVTHEQLDQPARAVLAFERAVELAPGRALFHENLGRAREAAGDYDGAIAAYHDALRRDTSLVRSMRGAAWLLATHPDPQRRDPAQAIRIAETAGQLTDFRSPEVLEALAAGLAGSGQFGPAREALDRAMELARAGGREDLLARYQAHAELFAAGTPIVLEN